MLHTANPVIKHKAGLPNLALVLSNVSKACKIMSVSRNVNGPIIRDTYSWSCSNTVVVL